MPRLYSLLAFGTFCMLFALVAYRQTKRKSPQSRMCFVALVPGCIGIWMVFWGLAKEPLLCWTCPPVRAIRSLAPSTVQEFRIEPHPSQEIYGTLVTSPVVIKDAKTISRIAQCLASGQHWSPNHPDSRWLCILCCVTDEGTHYCEVNATTNNGTLISVNSAIHEGWILAQYRQDEIGRIIENAVAGQPKSNDNRE